MLGRESSSKVEEYSEMAADERRAVFVDTTFDTHLAIPISPLDSVSSLKRQICLEHFKYFRNFGRITTDALLVEVNNCYYHLPDTMLLKTAFHGVATTWLIFADVRKSVGSFGSLDLYESKHIKLPTQHHLESKHVEPSQLHVTPDMSSKKKKKKSKRKDKHDLGKINVDEINVPPTEMSEPKENVKTRSDVSKIGSQDWKIVLQKDPPEFHVKRQMVEKTLERGQWVVPRAVEVSGTKHINEPWVGHRDTTVVQPSVILLEDGGVNTVKDLKEGSEFVHQSEGTSTQFTETLNKERGIANVGSPPGPRVKKSKKRKKSDIDGVNPCHAATSVQGLDFLEKSDPLTDYKNTICNSEDKGIRNAEKVSLSQLSNVPELLSQHDPLNLVKEIEEDITSLKSDNTAKKRKTTEGGQESKKIAENVSPLPLNNVPELLLSQNESLNFDKSEKEIEQDIAPSKSENAGKKKKIKKAKSSGTDIQDLSSKGLSEDQKADDTKHICGEISQVDGINRPEDSVETGSGKLKKRSRNKKSIPLKDPPGSLMKEQPDDETKEVAAPVTVIQIDKPKIRSQKKQPDPAQDLSSLLVNQHIEDAPRKMGAPKTVDHIFTGGDTNDALLKSENTAKKRKTKANEREYRKSTEDLSLSHMNNVPKLLVSQGESLNMVEEKEIGEDVCLKSENTANKRKNDKAKTSSKENEVMSSKRPNDAGGSGDTRHICGELSLLDDISKPEYSMEIMNGRLKKRSRDRRAVPGMGPPASPVKGHPDEEIRETASPVTVSQIEKAKKRSQKKQPVPKQDLFRLHLNQHLYQTPMELDTPKLVEQADGLLRNCNIDDSKNQEVIQGEGHQDESIEILALQVRSGLEDLRYLENPQTSKQKAKKLDQPSSVDTSSNGHKLIGSIKNKGSAKTSELQKSSNHQKHGKSMPPLSAKHLTISNMMETLVPPADPTNTLRKIGVSCATVDDASNSTDASSMSSGDSGRKIRQWEKAMEPPKKLKNNSIDLRRSSRLSVKESVNASTPKKGLFSSGAIFEDGSSSSSDDEDINDDLNSSTTLPPDNLSSSDYSEGESQGVVKSQNDTSNGNGRSNTNSSGLKLESLLRSSSRYKKAKLVALQSQDEEFVPDSQANE